MVHQLPRELRDIIYTYILESRCSNRQHQVLMVDNPTDWNLAEFTSNPKHLGIRRFTIKGVEIPHFAVYEHVHETYRIELAETLYRTKLLRVASMHELKFTLNYDVLATSCDPKEHVRHIQIELKFDCGTKTQAQYAKQLEPLWYLRHIKHLEGLKVGFIVHFIYDDVIPLLQEATSPLVQHLVSEGARVGWYKKGRGKDAPSKLGHGTA
ncbi:uncharacterized protein J4E79_005426 [Alternaria viburni]|uniref:uncharacterized protein n=1 Tax=Alternaria viburni TaxID=566460 RepID=UPI0020C33E57|nr:uncharacterized protein J4E79_005426 [Alternaria viburni]KAI4660858.1 hypothetical protein J4E79_005426 [Alternaria viburni]